MAWRPLQCSKQTQLHHRALCKLQKLWNTIHYTAINRGYKNDFINNHQGKTIYSVVKIKDRFMNFTDIFSTPHNINLSEFNFKRPIVTTQWHCVQTSVYPLPAVTEVTRLISNCTLTDQLPHQPLPKNYISALPVQGTKKILFRFHYIMTTNLVLKLRAPHTFNI